MREEDERQKEAHVVALRFFQKRITHTLLFFPSPLAPRPFSPAPVPPLSAPSREKNNQALASRKKLTWWRGGFFRSGSLTRSCSFWGFRVLCGLPLRDPRWQ